MSYALEIIGFLLTIIEIFFPRKAVTLESWIDSIPQKAPKLFYGGFLASLNKVTASAIGNLSRNPSENTEEIKTPGSILKWHFKNLFFALLFASLFALLIYLIISYSDMESILHKPTVLLPMAIVALILLVSFFGFLVSLVTITFVVSLKLIVHSLNKMSKGRAIGAIGLIIAAIGIISKFL